MKRTVKGIMKKTIELNLDIKDKFFVELKEAIIAHGEFGIGFQAIDAVNPVISGTLSAFRKEAIKQTEKTNNTLTSPGFFHYSFEHKEHVYPEIHNLLEDCIDQAFNRRVHTTTLERFTDLVEKLMVDTADKQAEEKKIKVPALVNPDKELVSIISYITQTWDGFDQVDAGAFFTEIWNSCTSATRNQFDQYAFNDFQESFKYSKNIFKEVSGSSLKSSELQLQMMLSQFSLARTLKDEWDYEKNCRFIMADIKKSFPDAKSLRPKGWYELAKNYKDYEGMVEFDSKQAKKMFKGMDSGTAGSYPFEVRVALPHVMYDDKCQGRKPLEVLIGAIVGHAYVMAEHNNSSKMLAEWVKVKQQIDDPNIKEISLDFNEPLNKALKHLMTSGGDDEKAVFDILGIESTQKKRIKRY